MTSFKTFTAKNGAACGGTMSGLFNPMSMGTALSKSKQSLQSFSIQSCADPAMGFLFAA